jgi:hypothetical protein
MLIYERGAFAVSYAECILRYVSYLSNETKFCSICYSNAFHICSQNSRCLWLLFRMCRTRATESDFDVYLLLLITGITSAWVFHIRFIFFHEVTVFRHVSVITFVNKHLCFLHLTVWSRAFVLLDQPQLHVGKEVWFESVIYTPSM